jgi:putative beta-barrel porin BBP2
MNGDQGWMSWITRARTWIIILGAACVLLSGLGSAKAQSPTPPPVSPPTLRSLPDGTDTLALGNWLLYPTLGVYTLYDTNLYSSATAPVKGTGFNIHPSILAIDDKGIWQTSVYGNIDSKIYPFIDSTNDTFDRQAGFIERYEAMRDLTFTVQGDYLHRTNAYVFIPSIPGPVVSPATPPTPGSASVAAQQETNINPNDTFTGTGTIYKEFNRAFVSVIGNVSQTNYQNTNLVTDFTTESYNGNGGVWITPQVYAYARGSQSFQEPAVGLRSNSFSTAAGLGTAQIGFFSGSVYYGQQGAEVENSGTAGGAIYGGVLTYFPSDVWKISLSADQLTNISNIVVGASFGNPQGLSGLPLSASPVPIQDSVHSTSTSIRTDYQFSEQTSFFGVLGYTRVNYLTMPQLDNSWVASIGIRHNLSKKLTLTFDYQYTKFQANVPSTSFVRDYTALGAIYKF